MTKKEKQLIAKLLELASDEFSNHGCNDVESELVEHLTDKEKIDLARRICKWNGDPEEFDGTVNSFDHLPDWYLMSFFAHELEK